MLINYKINNCLIYYDIPFDDSKKTNLKKLILPPCLLISHTSDKPPTDDAP